MKQKQIKWKEVELKEVAEIVSGSTPSTIKPEYWNGEVNWITPAEIIEGNNWYYSETRKKITKKGLESASINIFPKGTVMLTSRAPIGKVAIAGREMCSNQGFKNFICDSKKINNEYLYFWLRSQKSYLNSIGNGATFKEVSKSIVSKIKIPLPFSNNQPDLAEQQRIISILEKAEKQKERCKKAEELLDEYLKSIFNEMFYNKGFEEVSLGNKKYFEIIMGQSPPGNSYNKNKNGMPFFQGKKEFGEKNPIVEQWTTEPSKIALLNDILISVRAPVGSINLANTECCIGRGLASIRCKKEASKEFIYSFLKINEKEIEKLGNGSTFKAITSKQLLAISIPLPPLLLQQKFANIVEKVEKMKEEIKKTKQSSEELFNSLMTKAFKGEL